MMRASGWCLGLLLLAGPAAASEPAAGKVVTDLWDAAYLDGTRAGYVHTTVLEVERDGQKVLRSNIVLDMTLRRFNDTIHMNVETGTEETANGKVLGVFMKQTLGKDQQLVLTGTVDGKQLQVKVAGNMNLDKKVPWDDKVVGLNHEHQIFKEKNVKPGDKFTYLHFEPMISAVVTVQVEVKDMEEVEIDKVKKKLLRVEAQPEKISGVQLPVTISWLDEERLPVRSQVDMPGLGKLTLLRTTRDLALKGITPAKISDVGLTQLISLNKRLGSAHDTSLVVYKITLPEDSDPGTAIAQDERQEVKNVKGKTFELHVKAVRVPPAKGPDDSKPSDEYLKSNYFINCADAKVKELAKNAIGDEADPWKKAQKIEKWVNRNMKAQNFTEAMATADHVAKTLEGDCTEYAMLTAAMCRAVGVPSRTAIGLVYVDMRNKGPVLGYHMWTEVWIRGQWMDLDATLGRGTIGAGHIKITEASWHDTQSLKPLLPVMRVMLAKPTIEVIRVEGGD